MHDEHDKHEWEVAARTLLRTEMMNHQVTYEVLSKRMKKMGIPNANVPNLRSKVSRGTFQAAFLLQALIAIGCEEINIKNLPIRKKL